jgi:hypothetical protein
MRDTITSPRLLGYVQLRVGGRVVALPVQAMKLDPDGGNRPGGFYVEGTECGICIDADATPNEVVDQIREASDDAARHMNRKFTN